MHLTCVPSRLRSRNFPDLGLEVGVENRDLRQRAGSQTRNARGTDLSVSQHFLCAIPTLLATLPPRFKHHLTFCLRARATVRCVCVQKGGGAMCALQGARRTGAFERPEARTRFIRPVPARRALPGPYSQSQAAISPSSEGLNGPHHADKTDFCGGGEARKGSRIEMRSLRCFGSLHDPTRVLSGGTFHSLCVQRFKISNHHTTL